MNSWAGTNDEWMKLRSLETKDLVRGENVLNTFSRRLFLPPFTFLWSLRLVGKAETLRLRTLNCRWLRWWVFHRAEMVVDVRLRITSVLRRRLGTLCVYKTLLCRKRQTVLHSRRAPSFLLKPSTVTVYSSSSSSRLWSVQVSESCSLNRITFSLNPVSVSLWSCWETELKKCSCKRILIQQPT